jgi:CheY-like chemotaxis protein
MRLEQQFHHAQKMESIGRLAGGVAHDFNNLLTVINGYSRMLLRKLKAGDPLRDSLEEIYKAGERAEGVTRQLLAFSRKQVLEPRRLDINRVVEDMRPMLERLVGEDIEVRVALHAEGGTIHADPHQLEQVVMNLVVNARDAMPGVGKLLVETACVERDESYVRSHPEAHVGRYVMLAVSDTGVGMDEETKRRIFEPFFTTKPTGKGTGLGLAMVQGIVAQSGGYIEVYSEKGEGTTFKVYLPALAEPATAGFPASAAPVTGGKETVLVVEDQVEVLAYAVAVLKEYGYWVIPAGTAGEALLLCEREQHIDLVLTDIIMPNLNGRELAERLEKLRPGIRVLFMSGYTDDAIVQRGVLEHNAKFIQKPFSPEELAGKVREMLGPPVPAARIVVADDEAGVRSFLRKVLEDSGYEVIEAADGRQALKQARAGHVNLVITDLVMPEQEGLETIQALRRDLPGVRIIAISGAFGGQFLKAAGWLGADAVLDKPVSAEALLAMVTKVLKLQR